MAEGSFQSLDLIRARAELEQVFEQVLRGRRRVEITCNGDTCVLISKTELDSFERALEILSGSDRGLAMHELMLRIAREASPWRGELSDRGPAIAAASGVG